MLFTVDMKKKWKCPQVSHFELKFHNVCRNRYQPKQKHGLTDAAESNIYQKNFFRWWISNKLLLCIQWINFWSLFIAVSVSHVSMLITSRFYPRDCGTHTPPHYTLAPRFSYLQNTQTYTQTLTHTWSIHIIWSRVLRLSGDCGVHTVLTLQKCYNSLLSVGSQEN